MSIYELFFLFLIENEFYYSEAIELIYCYRKIMFGFVITFWLLQRFDMIKVKKVNYHYDLYFRSQRNQDNKV